MPGTKARAAKAVATIKAKDPDFFRRVGAIGGKNGRTGGFAANRELARIAGAKGGRTSKRRPAAPKEDATPKMGAFLGKLKGQWRG